MLCPVDQTTLLISDKQGIEIDYCPKCRGVWLDRGELDKLIQADTKSHSRSHNHNNRQNQNEESEGGFLENIFDMFGN